MGSRPKKGWSHRASVILQRPGSQPPSCERAPVPRATSTRTGRSAVSVQASHHVAKRHRAVVSPDRLGLLVSAAEAAWGTFHCLPASAAHTSPSHRILQPLYNSPSSSEPGFFSFSHNSHGQPSSTSIKCYPPTLAFSHAEHRSTKYLGAVTVVTTQATPTSLVVCDNSGSQMGPAAC